MSDSDALMRELLHAHQAGNDRRARELADAIRRSRRPTDWWNWRVLPGSELERTLRHRQEPRLALPETGAHLEPRSFHD